MNMSKLAFALVGAIAMPLGALAVEESRQSGQQQQYGTSQMGQPEAGQAGGEMAKPKAKTEKPQKKGAEGSAALPMFESLDTDKDGYITKTEVKRSATAKRSFRDLDTDRDNKISQAEWQAGGGE